MKTRMHANRAKKQIDPISANYILWQKYWQKHNLNRLKYAVMEYVGNVLFEADEEILLKYCLLKANKGALEHGPGLVINPKDLQGDKLEEVVDLINYITREYYDK